jgi:hypothetical protein
MTETQFNTFTPDPTLLSRLRRPHIESPVLVHSFALIRKIAMQAMEDLNAYANCRLTHDTISRLGNKPAELPMPYAYNKSMEGLVLACEGEANLMPLVRCHCIL